MSLIGGPGCYKWDGQRFLQVSGGGTLVLIDGLFKLSYGPKDLIVMDGNYFHAVTVLCDLPKAITDKNREQLERLSIIIFNRWKRSGMPAPAKVYHNTWLPEWWDAVPWKVGCEPSPVAMRRKRPSWMLDPEWAL